MMVATLDFYQEQAASTAKYELQDIHMPASVYTALGLRRAG